MLHSPASSWSSPTTEAHPDRRSVPALLARMAELDERRTIVASELGVRVSRSLVDGLCPTLTADHERLARRLQRINRARTTAFRIFLAARS